MRPKQHRIKLTLDERTELESAVKATSVSFEKRRRAKVLLLCDESEFGLGLEDAQVALTESIPWNDIENLFRGLGAEISEGSGSRVRIALNGVRAVFHRPHPKRVTDKGAVASVRKFLITTGVEQ